MDLPGLILPLLASALSQVATSSQPEAPLGGPKVSTPAKAPTLAARDLDGKVRRPEGSPEEAAARLLELDAQSRAKVDAVFAKRARVLEAFIEENLDLITRLITAENAPGNEKFSLVLETLDKSRGLRADGPLDAQVRAVLPQSQRNRFDRLVKEYWDAIVAEDKQEKKPKGRLGAVMDEKFKSLGRELETAYKRCERSGALLYHYLFDSIKVTPEQEKQLRTLCSNYAMGGLDNKKTQALALANLMQVLTPEQGRQLGAKFKGAQPKYEKKAEKAADLKESPKTDEPVTK